MGRIKYQIIAWVSPDWFMFTLSIFRKKTVHENHKGSDYSRSKPRLIFYPTSHPSRLYYHTVESCALLVAILYHSWDKVTRTTGLNCLIDISTLFSSWMNIVLVWRYPNINNKSLYQIMDGGSSFPPMVPAHCSMLWVDTETWSFYNVFAPDDFRFGLDTEHEFRCLLGVLLPIRGPPQGHWRQNFKSLSWS